MSTTAKTTAEHVATENDSEVAGNSEKNVANVAK
jgi:hypothetical protein